MSRRSRSRIDSIHEESLTKNWKQIVDNIDPAYILDSLVQEGIVTLEENGDIMRTTSRKMQIQRIIEILVLAGNDNFEKFLHILEKDYFYIAVSIRETIKDIKSNGSGIVCEETPPSPKQPMHVSEHPVEHAEKQTLYLRHDSSDLSLTSESDCALSFGQRPRPDSQELNIYDDAISMRPKEPPLENAYETDCSTEYSSHQYKALQFPPTEIGGGGTTAKQENIYANTDYENIDTQQNFRDKTIELTNAINLNSFAPETVQNENLPEYLVGILNIHGWCPFVTDTNVKQIIPNITDGHGSYFIWYSSKNTAVVLTVMLPDTEKRCLNYKMKTRKAEGTCYNYYFQKESVFKTIKDLMKFTLSQGLLKP